MYHLYFMFGFQIADGNEAYLKWIEQATQK